MSAQLKLATTPVADDRAKFADHFHRINRILPEDQEVVSVSPDTPVREAFEIMRKHGFSQLPVMEGEAVMGVFSYRSFSVKLARFDSKKVNVMDLLVDEMMEVAGPTRFAHISHELSGILDALDKHEAVLVGEPRRLQGIVTTMDVLRYLHVISSRFVMLGEIELCIRDLLRAAMTPEEIKAAAELVLTHYQPATTPTTLEEMTFRDYATIVGDGRCWEKCQPVFGRSRDRASADLKTLAKIRNAVFHFKLELDEEDDQQIQDCREWLLRRANQLDAQAAKGAVHE